jgi:hypothetical protein
MQGLLPINRSSEPAFFEWALRHSSKDGHPYSVAHERNATVNGSAYVNDWYRASNGWYVLEARVAAGNATRNATFGPLGFGDVSGSTWDPDRDPRFIQIVWNGTALALQVCGNGCRSTLGNLTRQPFDGD